MPTGGLVLKEEGGRIVLAGDWTLVNLLRQPLPRNAFEARLADFAARRLPWDLNGLERLDSAAATLLWRAWGRAWPAEVVLGDEERLAIARAAAVPDALPPPPRRPFAEVEALGNQVLRAGRNFVELTELLGRLALDALGLLRTPRRAPFREFSATVYKSGAQALPVTALVGFLVGVVISYLSALQLRNFGAEPLIVNVMGLAIIRELGPVLAAVLVAGRSGSAMTAQIGVMRVTEEIDALTTMGIPATLRLVLPRVAALTLAMPLLVVWTSAMGLLGGMVSAHLQLGLTFDFLLHGLARAVPVPNLWIALTKGAVFGFLIAQIACHFGLKVRPNTESLSARTTSSVVTAITVVILADAIFALLTREIGIPAQ